MNVKIFIAIIVIMTALVFGASSFVETNVEYANIQTAMISHKKVQVKGEWLREKESKFDVTTGTFTFYMRDEQGTQMRVMLDGARPNNFELAQAIVIKGKYADSYFHASEILTKCPSKYETNSEVVKEKL